MSDIIYSCNICNKKYASNSSLWNHNRKFHNVRCMPIVTQNVVHCVPNVVPVQAKFTQKSDSTNNNKIYKCIKCAKPYYNRHSKYKHQKKCNKTEIKDIKTELVELKKHINIITKTSGNNNIKNSNNINNGVINHITINKIGEENINYLTDKNITDIFSKEIESIFIFVELLNFNADIPENHNHCVTNLSSKYLSIYNSDTKKIEKDRKKYVFDTILCKSIHNMEILFSKNINKFSKPKRDEIINTIDTIKNLRNSYNDRTLFNEIINKLNLISYNNKDTILDTWNNRSTDEHDDFTQDLANTTPAEYIEQRKIRLGNNSSANIINYTDTDD